MGWLTNHRNKSRLGQLLVRQQLITEEQLASAIALQHKTGQRLGDIFAELNLITHQHIDDALRRQRRLRLAAAVVAALVAPLETCAATAPPAAALTVLSEAELADTSAQGLSEDLLHEMSKLAHPVLGFLEADTSMKNVVYDPAKAAITINRDGTLTLSLPSSIGEIAFNNIRIKGAEGGSFGNVAITGIDLTGTSITIGRH